MGPLALVWLLLRPLAALDESARRVSDGHYDERVAVRGRDELAGLARDMNRMAAAVQERVEKLPVRPNTDTTAEKKAAADRAARQQSGGPEYKPNHRRPRRKPRGRGPGEG